VSAADAPQTIATVRRALTQAFTDAGIDSPDADARLLVAHALDIDRATLTTHGHRVLNAEDIATIERLRARRLKREPIAYMTGRKEFWSLAVQVTPDVLIPRPETETVVELVLDTVVGDALGMEKLRILDIGAGSGALLLALLCELENAIGTGTDISVAALAVARANAERHGLADRCNFIACDIAAGVTGRFDLIVSNPPYVARGDIAGLAPEVRDHEPTVALDGGNDGLDAYRAIAAQARDLLSPGGWLVVELGAGQEDAVRTLFTNAGLTVGPVRPDLAGIPRALAANTG
jgi:release factor glutamine methyltransferase